MKRAQESLNAVKGNLSRGFGEDAARLLEAPKKAKKTKFNIKKAQFESFNDAKKQRFAARFKTTVAEIEKELGIK